MQSIVLNFIDKKYIINIRDEADQSVMREIFKVREYRTAEEIIFQAKDPIVDVGAHVGFFVLYARALNQKIKIFALEPEKENAKMLAKHVKDNTIKNVKIIEEALGPETGKDKLVITPDNHNYHLLQEEEKLGKDERVIETKTVCFKDFCESNKIKKISLLKMDIEGGEYGVIENLDTDDFSKIGAIVMEYHNFWDRDYKVLEERLRENGFSVQSYPSKFDTWMGFLLARNKRIS